MKSILPELTSRILRQNDQSYLARELSLDLKFASQTDLLETTCQKKITFGEIQRYIKTGISYGYVLVPKLLHYDIQNPVTFLYEFLVWSPFPFGSIQHTIGALYQVNNVYLTYYIASQGINDEIIGNEGQRTLENVDVDGNIDYDIKTAVFYPNYKMSDTGVYNTVDEDYDNILLFDLLTTYRILKSRESCISINKSFAYDRTIDIFNQLIRDTTTVSGSMILFGYLYINLKVMNLPYAGPALPDISTPSEYIDKSNLDDLILRKYGSYIDMIPAMISDIKQYLYVLYHYL